MTQRHGTRVAHDADVQLSEARPRSRRRWEHRKPWPPLGEDLGRRLREAREASGTTQTAAAAKIGISPGWLGALERGTKAPSLPTAEAIVRHTPGLNASTIAELLAKAVPDEAFEDPERRQRRVQRMEQTSATALLGAVEREARTRELRCEVAELLRGWADMVMAGWYDGWLTDVRRLVIERRRREQRNPSHTSSRS